MELWGKHMTTIGGTDRTFFEMARVLVGDYWKKKGTLTAFPKIDTYRLFLLHYYDE